jgi:hypothetical protein
MQVTSAYKTNAYERSGGHLHHVHHEGINPRGRLTFLYSFIARDARDTRDARSAL